MKKRTLLAKVLKCVGIPVVVIYLLFSAFLLQSVKQSVTSLTTEELASKSQVASCQVNNYLTKYQGIAQQLMLNSEVQNFLKSTSSKQKIQETPGFKDVDQTLRNISAADRSNIIDSWVADTATKHCVDQTDGVSNFDISSRPWYQQLAKSKQLIITEPYEDVDSKVLTVSMIAPIFNGDTLSGVAGIDITLSQLYNTIKSYKLGNTGFYILTSAGGKLVYYPKAAMKGKDVTTSGMSANIVENIQNKKECSLSYTAMGKTNYGYLAPVGTTGWTVTTGLPENEFYSPYNRVVLSLTVAFLIAAVVIFLTIFLTSKSIVKPLVKLKNSANEIADGNLDITVDVRSADEVGQVALALARTVDRLKQYINYIDEISSVLDQIAVGNLAFELHCDYAGEFLKIKTSLENIQSSTKSLLENISVSADQVASGSGQVSDSAQSLAQGATEQAGSLEELSASIDEISGQVKKNTVQISHMAVNMNSTARGVEESSGRMDQMLTAMNEISASSNEIGKIIKVIDGIAFQTNILALNAAVEAARAGEAGKGFSVVADEVRSLAGKSSNAAKQTSKLIGSSVKKVEEGLALADGTSKALTEIAGQVKSINETIQQVKNASGQQFLSIKQITQGVEQISSVVQTTSATAEESAAASEELNGQAQSLKGLISRFKIEKG